MAQIILIILKCCNILTCSWGIILLPLWISLGSVGLYFLVFIAKLIFALKTKDKTIDSEV